MNVQVKLCSTDDSYYLCDISYTITEAIKVPRLHLLGELWFVALFWCFRSLYSPNGFKKKAQSMATASTDMLTHYLS